MTDKCCSNAEQLVGQKHVGGTSRRLIGKWAAVTFARRNHFELGASSMYRASIALVAVVLGSFGHELPAAEKRPNVVFVLTDDQRWDTISLTERSQLTTPNIDRLGKEGINFRN